MYKVDKIIVTTYFANAYKAMREGYTLYSIAQSQPFGCSFDTFSPFVPSDFCRSLAAQKRFKDYEREYKRVNLNADRLTQIIEKIATLYGHNIAFVCWEGRDKFCHRHLVADYLNKHKICSTAVVEF